MSISIAPCDNHQRVIDWVFKDPIFILSAPRAGSTLLFEQMSAQLPFFTIGDESHRIYAQFPSLRAENPQLDSGCLGKAHANAEIKAGMRHLFASQLRDHEGQIRDLSFMQQQQIPVCFLEKTPRNSLNIPFLLEVFPNARFIYLHREPKANVASLIEAWQFGLQSGHFVTFANLPDWPLKRWCFLLPPGWRKLKGQPLVNIAAFQWQQTNNIIVDELSKLQPNRWISLHYQDLIDQPIAALNRLGDFCGLGQINKPQALAQLPFSATTLTPPSADKWRKYQSELEALQPQFDDVCNNIRRFEQVCHIASVN